MFLGWFGPEFVAGFPVLAVLATSAFIGATTGVLSGFLLTLTGHHRQAAVIVIGSAVLNLGLSVALTSAFGSIGTAVATNDDLDDSRPGARRVLLEAAQSEGDSLGRGEALGRCAQCWR